MLAGYTECYTSTPIGSAATGAATSSSTPRGSLIPPATSPDGFANRELYGRGPTTDVARDLLHLRYQLLPYLLGQAHRAAAVGVPLARALVVDHPQDPTTWHLGNQWVLGDDLLVAPVADPEGERRVYLPEGDWAGPVTHTAAERVEPCRPTVGRLWSAGSWGRGVTA